jgi:flagellar basal body-associated protein FliL
MFLVYTLGAVKRQIVWLVRKNQDTAAVQNLQLKRPKIYFRPLNNFSFDCFADKIPDSDKLRPRF